MLSGIPEFASTVESVAKSQGNWAMRSRYLSLEFDAQKIIKERFAATYPFNGEKESLVLETMLRFPSFVETGQKILDITKPN